jgi:hypothetical protein
MLLAAFAAASPAQAQTGECLAAPDRERVAARDSRPMGFGLDRSNGDRVLRAFGRIEPGATERLDAILKDDPDVHAVWLDSAGGDPQEGLRLGRLLRARGMPTYVPSGAVCIGACADAFLGGSIRSAAPDAAIAFSGVALAPQAKGLAPEARERAAARWAEERADYYIRAGVSRGLLRLQLSDEAGAICRLSPDALRRYNVVNGER